MVLSSAELSSLLRFGKYNAVTVLEWCRREPNSRFWGFSTTALDVRDGMTGTVIFEGACAERWYRFILSSVLPLARIIFWVCFGTGADTGESARQRMAEV